MKTVYLPSLKGFVIILILVFAFSSNAQIIGFTGFEGFEDETLFRNQNWYDEGFSVPWSNGFNQNRAHVDDEFAIYGTNSLRIFYPAGTYGTSNNGAQAPLRVAPEDELYASYWLRFSENFDWGGTSEGGKLPGLASSGLCSGCEECTGCNGFTARLMWRQEGRGGALFVSYG